jgi:hypothetical protein
MTATNTPAMSDDEIAAYANHNCRNDDPFDAARIAIRLTRASDREALQEAVEALKFYAKRGHYEADRYTSAVHLDEYGNRARAALAKLTGGK